jgi:hypothetical protein
MSVKIAMQNLIAWLTQHSATIQTVSQLLSAVGVFLAVVAIGVNAYQVRRTRLPNRATTLYNVYKDARDFNLKTFVNIDKPEEKQRAAIWTALSVYASIFTFLYFGVLDRKSWQPLESDMKRLFEMFPQAKAAFETYSDEYDPRFVCYVRDFFRKYNIK